MAHALRATDGELSGQSFPVTRELLVGRGEACDLVIKDPRLSRRHARFFVEDDDLFVEDLGAPNGTFVNEQRVTKQRLRPGDEVLLGKTRLVVDAPTHHARHPASDPGHTLVKPVSKVSRFSLETVLADSALTSLAAGEETLLEAEPRSLERIARQSIQFAVLHEVSKIVQTERDTRTILARVLDLALRAIDGDRAYAALLDETGKLRIEVVRHRGLAPSARAPVTISQTLATRVMHERAGVLSRNVTLDERFLDSASIALSDTHTLVAVPILAQSQVLGLMGIESGVLKASFSERDLDLASVLGSTVGVTIDNIRLAEKREESIRALQSAQERLLLAQEELVKAEQLAVVGRLATGIAHEVKNQLSPFMLADMIAREYPDNPRITTATEMMVEAQNHILDLMNELRAFATGATVSHTLETHDLTAVVEGVLRFMQCDANMKRVRRTTFKASAHPRVALHPRAMRQVLVNLLRNAADAVPEGRGEIEVTVSAHASQAFVEIRDNGSGIPPEIAARVFEPFFSTKGERGLGLGLDISRKLVAEHGGNLSFEAVPEGGTRFRVALPRVMEERTEREI